MKQLVETIARALVDKPEAVELKVTPQDGGVLYELKVAPDDIGKVIGRDGRTVNALRTVLQHAALKKGEKARLEIVDDRRNGAAQGGQPVTPPAP
ncbi:MAG: KH domain-containing protein [Myxococcales bacterium]|nr:KH domain-containing protein [Myxococcales bacterium]